MRDWRDLNGDGEIDGAEMMFADEMLCTSKEEHMALFGNAGDFDDETDEDEEREYDLALHGLDPDELADMDEDDRMEVLEDAGLDPDDIVNIGLHFFHKDVRPYATFCNES